MIKNQSTYNHPEAFCLMQYQDTVTKEIEVLWNSRDGVTPFIIRSRRGNEAHHINWQQARCVPDYVPQSGMRLFVDASPKHVHIQQSAKDYVERMWDDASYPMSQSGYWPTKDAAIDHFIKQWTKPGSPTVIEAE